MTYFVTGGTGFIGEHLVANLAKRSGDIYLLTYKDAHRLDEIAEKYGIDRKRLIGLEGDLSQPNLGLDTRHINKLKGKIERFYHLAAIYDIRVAAEAQKKVNVAGTRNAIQLAEAIEAGCFNHFSSIAAAGLYKGTFYEDMFEEAKNLNDPYLQTKHESEGLVRNTCTIPFRIYRPGFVLGHSKTGFIPKVDGPYYLFKLIQTTRKALPEWVPMVGIQGGYLNCVPVDFIADAVDHISHKKGLDGKCFHLTDNNSHAVGDLMNIFAKSAHAPQTVVRVDSGVFGAIPPFMKKSVANFPPVRRIVDNFLEELEIPRSALGFINYPTRYDNHETQKALKGSGIQVPSLESYANNIWDYWERNLDPDLLRDKTVEGNVRGKNIVVTGGSSGIGEATAHLLAKNGARVIIAARTVEKLEATKQSIIEKGGECYTYSCDLSDLDDCDRFCAEVLKDHGHVDVLVNNAGRSIRRSIENSLDRFHDLQRTMQLNYFGCARLIYGFLPVMMERKRGHIINISSIGVLTNAPRFSAYVASKAALDAYSRCAASELSHKGINFTQINMPLVRTPMIAATDTYKNIPVMTPDEAAQLVADAIVDKKKKIATPLGTSVNIAYALMPKTMEIIMNTSYQMFSDSAAAKGKKEKGESKQLSSEQRILSAIMKGIHW